MDDDRNDTLVNVRAPGWQVLNWKAAARVLRDPDRGDVVGMSLSRFVREALNDAAEAVFAEHGEPSKDHLKPRVKGGGAKRKRKRGELEDE